MKVNVTPQEYQEIQNLLANGEVLVRLHGQPLPLEIVVRHDVPSIPWFSKGVERFECAARAARAATTAQREEK